MPRKPTPCWNRDRQSATSCSTTGTGHQPCDEKSRSHSASDSVKRQCGIGAVEEFDCREHQFGVTHVFEVVKEVFAFGEVKVACLAGYVSNFACGSIGRVLPA